MAQRPHVQHTVAARVSSNMHMSRGPRSQMSGESAMARVHFIVIRRERWSHVRACHVSMAAGQATDPTTSEAKDHSTCVRQPARRSAPVTADTRPKFTCCESVRCQKSHEKH
jgi:hypothetical protein